MSSLKAKDDTVDQKKALNPKAARGNAVAVPRWSGKLDAAVGRAFSIQVSHVLGGSVRTCLDGGRKGRATSKAREEDEER